MSRLDRHVAVVQSKLGLGRFLAALAVAVLGFFALVWVCVIVGRVLQVYPPQPWVLFWAGAGAAVLGAVIWSFFHKPTDVQAAVAIDERLGLKEKFSTALIYRDSSDPFAVAAVRDAERTAENVSLNKRFPLSFPMMANWTMAAGAVLLLTVWLFPRDLDLFGKEAQKKQLLALEAKRDDARHSAERALATVNSYPKALQGAAAVQLAKKDLENLLNQPINDPEQANRTAFKALQQSQEAIKEEIKNSDQFARAQSDQKMLRSLNPAADQQGPAADAQRDIAKGDFAKAIDDLNSAVDKFDKMSDEQKQQTAQQMAQMAAQLQQMAQQKQLQQQLQQMGATPQQAQQLQQTMQQAAQGNPQAQQQLQQMQQQMMQNASPQMQAKMGAAMKQMQAQANSQATAQQMQQAAQQMAQAMQQAAGQQGGQQQGQKQGQQAGQGQMGQAQQQMQQALGQMDAVQKDAEQMAAAADAAGAAADAAAAKAGGGNSPPGGDKGGGPGQRGQWAAGPNSNKGNGSGGPGRGGGGGGNADAAPFGIKKEMDPSQSNDTGRILASTFVKAGTVKGESKVQLSQAAESAMKDATDEVDEDAVSKENQKVVHDYFQTMQNDQQQ